MGGAPEHRWVQDEKGDSLQVYICAGCILEINTIATDILIGTQVEDGTYELYYVITTGASQEGDIHEIF